MTGLGSPEFIVRRSIQALGGLLALGAMWVAFSIAWPPTVDSVPPSESLLTNLPASLSTLDKPVPLASFDFVDRPLFRADRRPAPETLVDSTPVPKRKPMQETEKLEGFSLTGVFSSGVVQGVMLRSDDGDRIRVNLGDTLEGLTLRSVDARSAVFVSGNAGDESEVRLAMVLASIPMLSSRLAESRPAGESAPEAEAVGTDEPVADALSFDSIYASRADKKAARLARNQAMAERLQRDNGAVVDDSEKEQAVAIQR